MALNQTFALITGCSSGIGEQLALTFAARGVHVIATARRVESLQHLTSCHDNIVAVPLELQDLASIDALKNMVVQITGGRLDYLVNNAGTHYATTALDLDVAKAVDLFTTNVFAVMRLCQVFVPLLQKSSGGKIIQIGSVTRDVPVVWQAPYNASKAALSQYSRTLRLELHPLGIHVIEVVTGFVQSNILQHGFHTPEGSVYLPILKNMQQPKYNGNKNGMQARAYANSIVTQVMQKSAGGEIWEGNLAWILRLMISILPIYIMDWILYCRFKLHLINDDRSRIKQ